jgi:hypothetical protein
VDIPAVVGKLSWRRNGRMLSLLKEKTGFAPQDPLNEKYIRLAGNFHRTIPMPHPTEPISVWRGAMLGYMYTCSCQQDADPLRAL